LGDGERLQGFDVEGSVDNDMSVRITKVKAVCFVFCLVCFSVFYAFAGRLESSTPVVPTHFATIHYLPNGGVGGRVFHYRGYGRYIRTWALTREAANVSRIGYVFVEWNTEADGSGVSLLQREALSRVPVTESNNNTIRLYAIWERAPRIMPPSTPRPIPRQGNTGWTTVATPPYKMVYVEGEYLDLTGMGITRIDGQRILDPLWGFVLERRHTLEIANHSMEFYTYRVTRPDGTILSFREDLETPYRPLTVYDRFVSFRGFYQWRVGASLSRTTVRFYLTVISQEDYLLMGRPEWFQRLEITPPHRTEFVAGEYLDFTGLEVRLIEGLKFDNGYERIKNVQQLPRDAITIPERYYFYPLTVEDTFVEISGRRQRMTNWVSEARIPLPHDVTGVFEITVSPCPYPPLIINWMRYIRGRQLTSINRDMSLED